MNLSYSYASSAVVKNVTNLFLDESSRRVLH
jgi:hypothetical protein